MKIYVARHGQALSNVMGVNNADPKNNFSLTKLGVRQAEAIAHTLKDVDLQKIYVSELERTQQTGSLVNKYHDCPIIIDARLNDNKTDCEGKTYKEYYDELFKKHNKWAARLNDGESAIDVNKRVDSFMNDIKQNGDKNVLVITSLFIIQQIEKLLYGYDYQAAWDIFYPTGAINEYTI